MNVKLMCGVVVSTLDYLPRGLLSDLPLLPHLSCIVLNFYLYHQVKVEKYYTPEQRKVMEQKAKIEEERRAKERGENARDRALVDMMGGVLEIKKEDELKKVGL